MKSDITIIKWVYALTAIIHTDNGFRLGYRHPRGINVQEFNAPDEQIHIIKKVNEVLNGKRD